MNKPILRADRLQRGWFLAVCIIAATMLPLMALAGDVTVTKQTFTYKNLDDATAPLQADVYRPSDNTVRPVVIFIHGGALMMGGRGANAYMRPGWLFDVLLKAGYAVVSIDYRMAPQVQLPAIIEDLQDACRWVRENGPELFHVNPKKIFVMGESAGGYLTQVAGFRVNPPPTALVSFWGYGDIAGDWYSQPDEFYRKQPLVTKEDADKLGGRSLYLYSRQNGLWPKILTGHDPDTEPHAFDPFCPLRNVTHHYPPIMLVHGTNDTDVPYEQSAMMDKKLTEKGVKHEFVTIPGGHHGFSNADAAVATKAYEQMLEFLKKY